MGHVHQNNGGNGQTRQLSQEDVGGGRETKVSFGVALINSQI